MKKPLQAFHLALPVMDLNFFGHQVSLHLVDVRDADVPANPVDGDSVPARHFGNALEFKSFADPTQLFAT